jgi:hypothetical protein
LNLFCCFDCLFFIAEVAQRPPHEGQKTKVTLIDLTASDSEDE